MGEVANLLCNIPNNLCRYSAFKEVESYSYSWRVAARNNFLPKHTLQKGAGRKSNFTVGQPDKHCLGDPWPTSTISHVHITRGDPQNMEFIYKKLHICFYIFKLQSPSKYSLFDAIHLSRCFPICLQQSLNLLVLMPFKYFLCSAFSTSAKSFPFRIFFIQGNKQKKVAGGKIRWIRRVGQGGSMPFLVRNCWTLRVLWAGELINHPS